MSDAVVCDWCGGVAHPETADQTWVHLSIANPDYEQPRSMFEPAKQHRWITWHFCTVTCAGLGCQAVSAVTEGGRREH